jgi:MFS superfamily sulfate permease-like transporter
MDGIAVAVALSLIDQVRHTYRPRTRVVVEGDEGRWQAVAAAPDRLAAPGVLVYRFEANLFYANAGLFMEEILRLVSAAKEPIRTLVLDASSINDVDYTAAKMLLQLRTELGKRGVAVATIATRDGVLDDLRRFGLARDSGKVYPTVDAAVSALREAGHAAAGTQTSSTG